MGVKGSGFRGLGFRGITVKWFRGLFCNDVFQLSGRADVMSIACVESALFVFEVWPGRILGGSCDLVSTVIST